MSSNNKNNNNNNNNNTDDCKRYATICRLCLRSDGFMLGIFNRIQGKEKSIYKKIIDCVALEVI